MIIGYTLVMWSVIILIPDVLIRIFSSDASLIKDAVPALKQYFAAFIFMDLQYMGQTVFKSLNKKKHAIFFSAASESIHRGTIDLSDAICVTYGDGWGISC